MTKLGLQELSGHRPQESCWRLQSGRLQLTGPELVLPLARQIKVAGTMVSVSQAPAG